MSTSKFLNQQQTAVPAEFRKTEEKIKRLNIMRQELSDFQQMWKSILECAKMQSPESYIAVKSCHKKWWKLFLAENPKAHALLKQDKLLKKILCKVRDGLKEDIKESKLIGKVEYDASRKRYQEFEKECSMAESELEHIYSIETSDSICRFQVYFEQVLSN